MDEREKRKRKPNPRQNANAFSKHTFFYFIKIIIDGLRKEIEEEDLPEVLPELKSSSLTDKLEQKWNEELKSAKKGNASPNLLKVLFKMFGPTLFRLSFILAFSDLVLKLGQSLLLVNFLSYYDPDAHTSKSEAYGYGFGLILCALSIVLIDKPVFFECYKLGMQIRIAYGSLIYRKSLTLSAAALKDVTAGKVVNMLSNDINRFNTLGFHINYLWIAPTQAGLAMYYAYNYVGFSAFVGIGILLLFIPLQYLIGKMISHYRLKVALKQDARLRLMSEIVSGIKVIKMYAWEKPYAKLVTQIRRDEVKALRGQAFTKAINLSTVWFQTRSALVVTLLVYILWENQLKAQEVFLISCIYQTLNVSMVKFFPDAVSAVTEFKVTIDRLKQFLLMDQHFIEAEKIARNEIWTITSLDGTYKSHRYTVKSDYSIILDDCTVGWKGSDSVLNDVTMKIERGSLVGVIGAVGAGKSTLLQVILKELPLVKGRIAVEGSVSYASQEAWLFGNTVRQNILFGRPMEEVRYRKVVKVCALERDFSLFKYGDQSVVGEKGVQLSGGQRARINLARAVYHDADVYLLDDPLSAVDTRVGQQLFSDCIKGFLKNKTVVLVTHQLQYLKDVDKVFILKDGMVTCTSSCDAIPTFNDKEHEGHHHHVEDGTNAAPPEEEQKSSGSIKMAVYLAYVKAAGSCFVVLLGLALMIFTQFSISLLDFFVGFWTNLEQARYANATEVPPFWDFSTETSSEICLALILVVIVASLGRSMLLMYFCLTASRNLHDAMFSAVVRAKSRFFDVNSSGRILNRFGKDIGAIDEFLPLCLVETMLILSSVLGSILLITYINYWTIVPVTLMLTLLYFVTHAYLKISRPLKRLEGVTRSPVFNHVCSSLRGLQTVRALKMQNVLQKEFDDHQDLHSSAYCLFVAGARAYCYWMELICIAYIGSVIAYYIVSDENDKGGTVGVAIAQTLTIMGALQWGMLQATEMENYMTSVERVNEYIADVPQEDSLDSAPDKKPPPEWPRRGQIEASNVYLYYTPAEAVLRNLNFVIRPLQKVGVVGRTGAGKSSLIGTLFRMADTTGAILIDGVNTMEIGLHDLRAKVSIIPQDPVLFSGTIRKNLDPFNEYDDEKLWRALEDVEMKRVVEDMGPDLGAKVDEGGANFSVGQRQLICMARAIIRNNKILILDEATANVDPQTDALIQNTIRIKFRECTVVTVAHRLHTVMDSDRILVMDAGTIAQFDHPHVLLQDRDGIFYSMVQQAGTETARTLAGVAAENYKNSERDIESYRNEKALAHKGQI